MSGDQRDNRPLNDLELLILHYAYTRHPTPVTPAEVRAWVESKTEAELAEILGHWPKGVNT